MGFYTEPAFFVLAALAAIPAIVLGCAERSLRGYGFAASVVFLALLFMHTPMQMAALLFFVVLATLLFLFVQHLFASQRPHAVGLYRVALALTIAPVAVYKVSEVFGGNLLGFLGISYLTFKAVQVLIELRDGLIERMSVFDYLYFLVFFTPFTSGPIMRSRPFVERLHAPLSRSDYLDGLSLGLLRILGGATYKFVFAAFASWASWFLPQYIGTSTPLAAAGGEVVAAFFYGLNMFFDFAGYSLMAIGLGSVFGVEVPRNFRMPFLSVDIKDFWNRWHISLSHWLRDFVFMRLTRTLLKRKVLKSRLTTACTGYIANMTLMGVWHGLTLDYVIYGFYHGALLALCEVFQRKSKFYKAHKDQRWFKVLSWALTMIAVFVGFSLFSGQISQLVRGM
ncbi:MAG: D-alanyl-lipoteichoic acid biosynthesis protein DltB [Eggerthellaceae bacterium]|nr:D-alanyl-lipoteichoic acid biosynthesis protein DltB [Eggerthellaceae bacterium]